MVWETVKKEMTITRILLALVAILLCCYLTFGLPQSSETDEANNDQGLEMLNFIRDYLEQNESLTEHPQIIPDANPTENPKPRKFYSVTPPFQNSKNEFQRTKHNDLDNGNRKHAPELDHSTNSTTNSSEPELDLTIVFGTEDQPKKEDSGILDVKNSDEKHVDKIMFNHLLFSKTTRVKKVEEVFEDLVAQNVRRIIKEDRLERVEVLKNREMETIGNDFGIKDLLSL